MEELREFERYVAHLSEGLGHADRHAGLRGYCTGLMAPLKRKRVEPMASHLAPMATRSRHQSLHHFVADSAWSDEQMLLRVAQWVVPAMDFSDGGWWIVDDTGFPKHGVHSVGVARQYCGMLGKQDNCQVAVSVTLACQTGSLPVVWQLYLPRDWDVLNDGVAAGARAAAACAAQRAWRSAHAAAPGASQAPAPAVDQGAGVRAKSFTVADHRMARGQQLHPALALCPSSRARGPSPAPAHADASRRVASHRVARRS